MTDQFSVSPPSHRSNRTFLILAVLVLLAAAGALGYVYGRVRAYQPSLTAFPDYTQRAPTYTPDTSYATEEPESSLGETGTEGPFTTINGNTINTAPSLHLFVSDEDAKRLSENEGRYVAHPESLVAYFQAGTTTYKGTPVPIIFVVAGFDGPAFGNDYYTFVQTKNGVVLLANHSTKLAAATSSPISDEGLLKSQFTVDNTTTLNSLAIPPTLTSGIARQVVRLERVVPFNEVPRDNLVKAFSNSVVGDVYTTTSTYGFYVPRGPLVGIYYLSVDFYDKDDLVPQITFDVGGKNTQAYSYHGAFNGCGWRNYTAVVDESVVNRATDLVAVGKNIKGDTIYALKNADHIELKNVYQSAFAYGTEEKMSYDAFLAARPLLFWVDPFGRLVELLNTKFQPAVECGKPVIYLYPTTTTSVSVKLYPQGGFTVTEPPYYAGWDVLAEPNGNLHIGFSSTTYRFLYWEGRGGYYEQPKTGWVVQRRSVESFLKTKLKLLGLNATETADFMEFWLPRMQAKPYYFITFMDNKVMDTLAPMLVSPKPDSIIRILMDFTPLDKPIAAKPYVIRTPKRTGFTVIEWGGVLRDLTATSSKK